MIRFWLGFLAVFGAVGGMDDPMLQDRFLEQCLVAALGLAVMWWGVSAKEKQGWR